MKTVSVSELKKNWDEIERRVQQGEIIEVMRRGKLSLRLVPVSPRKIVEWEDHLATAAKTEGSGGSQTLRQNRDGRW